VKNRSIVVVFFVHFVVYVLCSTLAMHISLLWHKILAGLLGNVLDVHANSRAGKNVVSYMKKCCRNSSGLCFY